LSLWLFLEEKENQNMGGCINTVVIGVPVTLGWQQLLPFGSPFQQMHKQ